MKYIVYSYDTLMATAPKGGEVEVHDDRYGAVAAAVRMAEAHGDGRVDAYHLPGIMTLYVHKDTHLGAIIQEWKPS